MYIHSQLSFVVLMLFSQYHLTLVYGHARNRNLCIHDQSQQNTEPLLAEIFINMEVWEIAWKLKHYSQDQTVAHLAK